MPRHTFLIITTFSLILTACSVREISTATPIVETDAIITLTATTLPPTFTLTIEPTSTDTQRPSPTRGPTATPWRPVLPEGKCSPSETRSCKALIVLPAKYYANQARFTFIDFRSAGFSVFKASKAPDVVEVCEEGVGIPAPDKTVSVDLKLSEVNVAEYDAVVFIGGFGCQDQWHDEESHQIIRDAVEQGKVLGAIGCAPTILAHAGVMVGRRSAICDLDAMVKGGKDYCEVLESLGAICSNYSIERDGLIVTARQKSQNFVPGVVQVIMEVTGEP